LWLTLPHRTVLNRRWLACAAVAIHALIAFSLLALWPSRPVLLVEMTSSVVSRAQIYFDTGAGLSEVNSESVPVRGTGGIERLRLPLPRARITGLRFDPITSPGSIVLHRASILRPDGSTAVVFLPRQIKAIVGFDQMESLPAGVRYRVRTDSYDPQFTLDLDAPIDLRSRMPPTSAIVWVVLCNAIFLCAEAFLIRGRGVGFMRAIDGRVLAAAHRLSSADFIAFDRLAIWFYAVSGLLFLVFVAANLNGSSMGIFYYNSKVGAAPRLLAGVPQGIRADEFNYETPAILNQYFREDPFQLSQTPLGRRSVGLVAGLPVRQITTWLRPQYWAFFILPADYAFSAWWQAKWLIMALGTFTLLLLLTGSSGLALCGTLWLLFSQFTQWCFSWPSMLPEMCGFFCLSLVLAAYLTVGRNAVALALSALGCAACIVNFALCAYPPHLIPYGWAGIFLFAAWCAAKRTRILETAGRRARAIAFACCALLAGLLLFDVEWTVSQAIPAIAATTYPGHRSIAGGTLSLTRFATHFLAASETVQRFPPGYLNICEAAGFLWLAPFTLVSFGRMRALSRERRILLAGLWAGFILLFCWALIPIPAAVGRLMLLDRVSSTRLLPALGFLNIAIAMLVLSAPGARRGRQLAVTISLSALALYICLSAANSQVNLYFHTSEVLVGTLWSAALVAFLLEGRRLAFAAAAILPNVFLFGLINPIERGIDTVTKSSLFEVVHRNPRLLHGKWMVFGDGFPPSIFTAVGCDVYNGMRYVPDVDDFAIYARHHLDIGVFNNLGYIETRQLPEGAPARAALEQYGPMLNVSALDPLVKDLGVRYLAFHNRPGPPLLAHLKPLANGAVSEFWLYELIL
jgi:hypothetical protein